MKGAIYLDHHSTTPLDERVLGRMLPYLKDRFGNPSSQSHAWGFQARAAVDDARDRVATLLGARSEDIVFTSGATESNHLALLGVMRAATRRVVVSQPTEHSAVRNALDHLQTLGCEVRWIRVDSTGRVDLDHARTQIDDRVALVSIMHANNEIGTVQPLAELGAMAKAVGAWFHTDAAQSARHLSLDVEAMSVDLLSLSAHKFYGPKGVGALYVRRSSAPVKIEPLVPGGGQEGGLRPGTLATPNIVGLGAAASLVVEEGGEEAERVASLRDRLQRGLADIDDVVVHGHPRHRLPGNLNASFLGVKSDDFLADARELAVSTGSACASEEPQRPSPVLRAVGLSREVARCAIRFGLGRTTTEADVDRAVSIVQEVVRGRRRGGVASSLRAP